MCMLPDLFRMFLPQRGNTYADFQRHRSMYSFLHFESWVRRQTASSCDTQNECGNMRLPSITVASPPSGLRSCQNLGGRARRQSSTDRWLGDLSIVLWRTILSAKLTARVRERRACSDAVKELSWDVSWDRRSHKNSCSKFFMTYLTIGLS